MLTLKICCDISRDPGGSSSVRLVLSFTYFTCGSYYNILKSNLATFELWTRICQHSIDDRPMYPRRCGAVFTTASRVLYSSSSQADFCAINRRISRTTAIGDSAQCLITNFCCFQWMSMDVCRQVVCHQLQQPCRRR